MWPTPRVSPGRKCLLLILGAALLRAPQLRAGPSAARPAAASLVLITLDTTRADHVGRIEGASSLTPNLDALARQGARFIRALAPSPLTLPAHCSLLTGADPPIHGVRDNGVSALPADRPTLATVLSAHGYVSAAFVSSRVLDRRFGLGRGFRVYDDEMVAEHIGEQGYPERDAQAVTSAALSWISRLPPRRPYFLWVHYYDPHAPYEPPGDWKGASPAQRYAGEVAYVDRELGRLLAGLPQEPPQQLVAVVGDHGEMLGEHGERDHGVFLYRGSLEVPLILAGSRVPAGRVVSETVGTRALAATLLELLGLSGESHAFGPGLLGLGAAAQKVAPTPVYSETFLPANAYGWSPLRAASDGRFRLIAAPRPELYDFVADPSESRNLVSERPQEARRLQRVLADAERGTRARASPPPDPELARSLRSLGYLSGASRPQAEGIDPKDGIALLTEFEQAKEWIGEGRQREAVLKLEDLVKRSPGNVPFLMRLGEAQVAAGQAPAGLETLRHAVSLNPRLDFLHARLAQVYAGLGRAAEAKAEYEAALELNPRFAEAWMGLAEVALRSSPSGEELRILRRGEAAETHSAALLARLAQLELAADELPAAERHAQEAVRLMPEFHAAWWIVGEAAEKQGRVAEALSRFEKAVGLGLDDPRALLHLGRLLWQQGRAADARRHLERAAALGGGSAAAQEARRLLQSGP